MGSMGTKIKIAPSQIRTQKYCHIDTNILNNSWLNQCTRSSSVPAMMVLHWHLGGEGMEGSIHMGVWPDMGVRPEERTMVNSIPPPLPQTVRARNKKICINSMLKVPWAATFGTFQRECVKWLRSYIWSCVIPFTVSDVCVILTNCWSVLH